MQRFSHSAKFLVTNQAIMLNSFFRVSERNHAGFILMTELASRGDQYVSLKEVAERMTISQAYLEEIAASLKQAGLIEGRTGPGGGYRLAQKPEEISADKIITALEGPVLLVECQKSANECPAAGRCTSKSLWNVLQKNIVHTLRETKLTDLV